MVVTYNDAGKVQRMHGGSYRYDGNVLEEMPIVGVGLDFEKISAKRQILACKVDGNRMFLTGKLSTGRTLEEMWELMNK